MEKTRGRRVMKRNGLIALAVIVSVSATTALFGVGQDPVPIPPPQLACPPGDVQHWDKIIFEVKKDKNALPVLSKDHHNTLFDIRVLAEPGTLVDSLELAREALGAAFNLSKEQVDNLEIDVKDIKYQVITCLQEPPIPSNGETAIVRCTSDLSGTPTYLFQQATVSDGLPNPSPASVNCAQALAGYQALGLVVIDTKWSDSLDVVIYTMTN